MASTQRRQYNVAPIVSKNEEETERCDADVDASPVSFFLLQYPHRYLITLSSLLPRLMYAIMRDICVYCAFYMGRLICILLHVSFTRFVSVQAKYQSIIHSASARKGEERLKKINKYLNTHNLTKYITFYVDIIIWM